MIRNLLIIQARLTSTRLPGKVMMTIKGKTILKRVWEAAKGSIADKVIVAWPERYPDLDENDVRERFRRISREFHSRNIIRITADCPLLTSDIINETIREFEKHEHIYYCNRDKYPDGFDVQVFRTFVLHSNATTHKEHVIIPEARTTPDKYLSVDTKEDLERVKKYAR